VLLLVPFPLETYFLFLIRSEPPSYHITLIVGRILRDRGVFGTVSVSWRILDTSTNVVSGEFQAPSGVVIFYPEETEKTIMLHAVADGVPEYDELVILEIYNITGRIEG